MNNHVSLGKFCFYQLICKTFPPQAICNVRYILYHDDHKRIRTLMAMHILNFVSTGLKSGKALSVVNCLITSYSFAGNKGEVYILGLEYFMEQSRYNEATT